MTYTVLIPEDVSAKGKDYLRERGYEIKMGRGSGEDTITQDVVDCDAILVRNAHYTRRIMEAGKKLKVIARHGTGVDNIDLEAASELGIQVVNGPAANIDSVADYTLALMLALNTDIFTCDRRTRAGDWEYRKSIPRREFAENTVGIVGFGRVGRAVAQRVLVGFNCRTLYFDDFAKDVPGHAKLSRAASLAQLLAEADIVSLHVPSLPETRGMIGERELAMMKRSAVLINCARGDVCDEPALIRALQGKNIAAAALDVYAREPLPADSPLLKLDNVILTQHCAGLSVSSVERMALFAAQGIDEVLSGKTPTWPVNTPAAMTKKE